MNDPLKQNDARIQDVEELVIRHFDGSLNADQEKQLAAAISNSVESKQLFLSYMRMEGRLHSLGRDGFLRSPDGKDVTALTAEMALTADMAHTSLDQNETETTVASKPNRYSFGSRSSYLKALGSLAAGILLMIFLSNAFAPSAVSANTILQRAQQTAAELVDRTYHLIFTDLSTQGSNQGEPVKKEFDLDLRGGGLFVIRPNDESYIMGSDGEVYWMARKRRGPVAVTSDYKTLAPELQRRIPNRRLVEMLASPNEPLLLDLSSLLELIKRAYDIELIDSEDETLHHIRATARVNRTSRMPIIDLVANAETGVIVKVEATRSGKAHAVFELQESRPLSKNWYHHESHFTDRVIIQLPSEAQ